MLLFFFSFSAFDLLAFMHSEISLETAILSQMSCLWEKLERLYFYFLHENIS